MEYNHSKLISGLPVHVQINTNESRDNECKLDMAGLHKYFQRVTMPRSEETGLGEAVTKEVNCAVERVLREQNGDATVNGGQTCKRKYVHFSPEDRAKVAKYAAQCGNTAVAFEDCD